MSSSDKKELFKFIKLLKRDFENKFEYSIDSAKDLVRASVIISDITKPDKINEATLRNLWEKDEPKKMPYKSTLSLIVKSLGGYNDWDHYRTVKELKMQEHSLFDIDAPQYKVEKMEIGHEFLIGWYPAHYVKFKYLGNYKFSVLECSDTVRLINGDIKYAIKFGISYTEHYHKDISSKEISGYPLYPSFVLKRPIDKSEEVEEEEILYNNIFI